MPTQLPSAKTFFRNQTPILGRPFYALTESQRELRLDTVTWGEREIFLEDLIHHPVKRVRMRAWTSNLETMRLLIRAWKQGVDMAGVYMPSLYYSDWSGLPRAPVAYVREAKSESELRMELRAIGKGGVFARQLPHIVKPYKGDVKPGQPEVNSQPVVDNPEPEPYVDAADQQYGVARKGAQPNLQELLENAARDRTLTPPPYAQAPEPMPWDPQPVAEDKPRRGGRPPRQSPWSSQSVLASHAAFQPPGNGSTGGANRGECFSASASISISARATSAGEASEGAERTEGTARAAQVGGPPTPGA